MGIKNDAIRQGQGDITVAEERASHVLTASVIVFARKAVPNVRLFPA
ncbi:MAG TPA: hypothetical protein VFN23_05495 [Ktedonobacteraceae bacterium]|nr:hypothetical protein [Ktedonobacteraceae bacterium]